MEYLHNANTNLGSLLTVCRLAVVIQVLGWSSFCTGITCQYCETVPSLAECDSTRECASNEICRTEIRTQDNSETYRMYCQQDQACLNEQNIYEQQCTGTAGSVCVTCCDTDLCNAPTPDSATAVVATTNAPTSTDTATTQDTTSTDAATTQSTTSEKVTTAMATTEAIQMQPATSPTARPNPSLTGLLFRLHRSAQRVNPQYVIDTSRTGSFIPCAMTCSQTANCKSFGYDSKDGLCYVVGFDASELSFSSTQTCNHYIPVIRNQ